MDISHKHIIFGLVDDKEHNEILELLPHDAHYYFTRASIPRSLDEQILRTYAGNHGLSGEACPDVKTAYISATRKAQKEDLIFICGSTFVVADFLNIIKEG
jgi:dihydrofolate synthase/folylpolyglutamate synthase